MDIESQSLTTCEVRRDSKHGQEEVFSDTEAK